MIFPCEPQLGNVDAVVSSCRHTAKDLWYKVKGVLVAYYFPFSCTKYSLSTLQYRESFNKDIKNHHGPRSPSLHVRPAVCRFRPSSDTDKIPNGSEIRRHINSSNQLSCKYVDKPHLHATDLTIKSHTSRRNSSGRHPPRNRLSRLRVRPAISQEISLQESLWLIPGSSG